MSDLSPKNIVAATSDAVDAAFKPIGEMGKAVGDSFNKSVKDFTDFVTNSPSKEKTVEETTEQQLASSEEVIAAPIDLSPATDAPSMKAKFARAVMLAMSLAPVVAVVLYALLAENTLPAPVVVEAPKKLCLLKLCVPKPF